MARTIHDVGRVSVFQLIHRWPDVVGVMAYTSTGRFGIEGVLGYVPLPEIPDVHIMEVAARHQPGSPEDWAACLGYSARLVPKPGALDLPDTAWSLEIDNIHDRNGAIKYGINKLYMGRMTIMEDGYDPSPKAQALATEKFEEKARQVLASAPKWWVGEPTR